MSVGIGGTDEERGGVPAEDGGSEALIAMTADVVRYTRGTKEDLSVQRAAEAVGSSIGKSE